MITHMGPIWDPHGLSHFTAGAQFNFFFKYNLFFMYKTKYVSFYSFSYQQEALNVIFTAK